MEACEPLAHQGKQDFILILEVLVDERWAVFDSSGDRTDCHGLPVLVRRDFFSRFDDSFANRGSFPIAALFDSHHIPVLKCATQLRQTQAFQPRAEVYFEAK